MSGSKFNREMCVELLRDKQAALASQGLERYPRRSDFGEDEVTAVKAFLGAWPRALEAAGLKPPRDNASVNRNREKRIISKRRSTQALKKGAKKKSKTGGDNGRI